ncbi:MAG: hypothetical protein ACOC0H_07295, partial [Thermodesulfobacteriota bacterium]
RVEMDKHLTAGGTFFLAPQVIAEFIHVITDSRRFQHPLLISGSIRKGQDLVACKGDSACNAHFGIH